jgi:radical SAM superfamily enzyme YgiQ (UPF0313 family)
VPEIVLATLNARWAHTALGLRSLLANLGDLAPRAALREHTLQESAGEIASSILGVAPRLVGLGAYVWNATALRGVVETLRRATPRLLVVIGGPEMRGDARSHPLFELADYVVVGEAEQSFAELARRLLAGDRPEGRVIESAPPALDTLALPYDLYGDDDLERRVVYLESARGCPFGCEFCLSALDHGVRRFPTAPLLAALERLWHRGLRRFRFVDRTFNRSDAEMRPLLDFFLGRPGDDWFVHLELVPTRLTPWARDALRRFPPGTLQLEVGVQTFDDTVARRINRPQRAEVVRETLRFLRRETHAHLHTDLIVGLPGEDLAGVARSFDELYAHAPHEIQVGMLKRLPGAPLARHDHAFAMRYDAAPPYQVLETSTLDGETVARMARFARYWDRLGNSGRLRQTLPLLLDGGSAFARFLALSDWLYQQLGSAVGVSFERYVALVADYLTGERQLPQDRVLSALAADWSRTGQRLPRWLRGHGTPTTTRAAARAQRPPRQARHRHD